MLLPFSSRYLRITVIILLFFCCWISIYVPLGGGSGDNYGSVVVKLILKKKTKTKTTSSNNETTTTTSNFFEGGGDEIVSVDGSHVQEVDDDVAEEDEEDELLPPFYPNRAFEYYKERHSQQALLREDNNNNERKFAVVYYWCPERAGNILHNMFNSMIWAMITNRTVLYKYDNYSNTLEDCERILQRSHWIPSYEEWSIKLNLEQPPVPIPIDTNRVRYDQQHQTVIFPQIPDVDSTNPTLFRNSWRDDPIDNRQESISYIQNMLNNQESKKMAGMLYYEGVNYLLGMLFRECFTIQVQPSTSNTLADLHLLPKQGGGGGSPSSSTTASLSIALHSRHPVVGDDGSYVQEEIDCLQHLIASYNENQTNPEGANSSGGGGAGGGQNATGADCQVYLLSDRPLTIEKLSHWLLERNCTPIFVNHKNNNNNVVEGANGNKKLMTMTEHGPWAGVGFIEDLALASEARYAVVGDFHRSSFMLLVEIIEYDRIIEAWRRKVQQQRVAKAAAVAAGGGGNENDINKDEEMEKTTVDIPDLLTSTLQEKPSAGYDYGPRTPTFRHHTLQEPLDPIQIMNQYKKWHHCHHHSASMVPEIIIKSFQQGHNNSMRRYVRVSYSCRNIYQGGTLNHYGILNALLLAIAMNRTVLWDNDDGDCNDLFHPRDWMTSFQNLDDTAVTIVQDADSDTPIIVFPRTSQKILNATDLSNILPSSEEGIASQDIIKKLFSEGADFLYGMLFDLSFELSSLVRSAIPKGLKTDRSFQTVALQLSWGHDNIADVSSVVKCLELVLAMNRQAGGLIYNQEPPACHVYIMHDLSNVIDHLSDWLMGQNCSVWRANLSTSTEKKNSQKFEAHGTPSGMLGYFQNAALLSKARSAWIGYNDSYGDGSNYNLIRELIEFCRRMDNWKLGRDPPLLTNLSTCILPED